MVQAREQAVIGLAREPQEGQAPVSVEAVFVVSSRMFESKARFDGVVLIEGGDAALHKIGNLVHGVIISARRLSHQREKGPWCNRAGGGPILRPSREK